MDIYKEIDELKRKLAEYQQTFKDVEAGINHLKSQNRSEIASKEKELEEWQTKFNQAQQTILNLSALLSQQEQKLVKQMIQELVLPKTLIEQKQAEPVIRAIKEQKEEMNKELTNAKQTSIILGVILSLTNGLFLFKKLKQKYKDITSKKIKF